MQPSDINTVVEGQLLCLPAVEYAQQQFWNGALALLSMALMLAVVVLTLALLRTRS